MKNTLKFSLILIGSALCVYGIYTIITPEFSLNAGPLRVESQGDHTQAYAMVASGLLCLIAGLVLRKK